ncbi:hypothetical protein BGZ57DRAFT_960450 [Hyaloscypha finlandica]|nr:hypothetical protein BGZ57DRAFT_960450 [Hyaloscypha finlandica]
MSTSFVQTGFWVDQNRSLLNQRQILLSDYRAGILTNTLAVLITSILKPVFELLRVPFWLLWRKVTSRWGLLRPTAVEEANDFYEFTGEVISAIVQQVRERWVGYHFVNHGAAPVPNRRRMAADALGAGAMIAVALGLPLTLLIASIISTGLKTDTIAISQAPHCGTYAYTTSFENSSTFVEFEHRAESESGLYASECYGDSSLIEDCNKFFNQTISYSSNNQADCPFDGRVCYGINDSIRLTTGLIPASILGVNADNTLLFNKTMICSPLVSGPDYVGIGESDQGEEQWEYWYGRSLADYTWANPIQESSWEIKGYSTGIHCSEPGAGDAQFVPLPEFMAGYYPVTISFISSHAIFYPRFREDPIFPARQKASFPWKDRALTLYYNNSTRAGVLGCVDQFQICRTAEGPCWDNGNVTLIFDDHSGESATVEQNIALLLLLALDYSTACGSIQFRGAEALDAQAKIAHMRSLPLPENQWQVEAEKMFQTSLARMQLNVFNLVRGTASGFDGYEDILPEKYRGVCKLVKIPTVGWRNINFVGVIGIVLVVLFMWIISRKTEDGAGEAHMIIVLLWDRFLRDLCFRVGKTVGTILGWTANGVKIGWEKVVLPLWELLELLLFEPAWRVLMSYL